MFRIHKVNTNEKSTELQGLAEKRLKRTQEVEDEKELSADDEMTENEEDEDTNSNGYYIKRLVTKGFRNDIDNRTRSPNKSLITSDMIVNNYGKLDDNFLNFEILNLKTYFDNNAWIKVKGLYESKLIHSKCPICDLLCLDLCIQCMECKYWYHFDCVKLTAYFKNTSKASWTCRKNKTVFIDCNL